MFVCIWSSAPYTVTEKLLYIIKGPMKVISGGSFLKPKATSV